MKLRNPPLDADFVRSVLDYDPQTGEFRWRYRADYPKKWNTRYAGKVAGAPTGSGYIAIQLPKPQNYPAHHLAWVYVYGMWPDKSIDHENGNRSDNRITNLRLADDSENGTNKRRQKNNTSGYVGVNFDSQRNLWRARANIRGTMYDGGFFETAEQAAIARATLVEKVHGEFLVRNPNRPRYRHNRERKKCHGQDANHR